MTVYTSLTDWKPTRATLHLYARLLGAVRAEVAEPHPLWWHISLRVEESGLGTGELDPNEGEGFSLTLDLDRHRLALGTSGGVRTIAELRDEPTGRELGEAALAALEQLGVVVELDRDRWEDDGERIYDEGDASDYHCALAATARAFGRFRDTLKGERSPVQLWPHHFDLSFERFFDRTVEHGDGEEKEESRAQIGFGLSPGDENHPEAYFYVTPWPFDRALLDVDLPPAGRWLTEPWEGALLPYAAVAGGDGALVDRLLDSVYRAAAPGLAG